MQFLTRAMAETSQTRSYCWA